MLRSLPYGQKIRGGHETSGTIRSTEPLDPFDFGGPSSPADPPYQPPPGTRVFDRKGVEYLVPADGVMAGINRQYAMGAFVVINITSGASRSSASWRASGLLDHDPTKPSNVASTFTLMPKPILVPLMGGTRVVARGVNFGEASRGIIASEALAEIVNDKYNMGTHVVVTDGGGTSSYATEEQLQANWERDIPVPSLSKRKDTF